MTVGESSGIPEELLVFLASGQNLDYEPRAVECGGTTLVDAASLDVVDVWVVSVDHECPDDPHADEEGYYVVPCVSLLASAEHYDPEGILVWIPDLRRFGTWDSDHWDLVVFPRATWGDIVAEPGRFLNAQWDPDETIGTRLKPWKHGFAWRAGRPAESGVGVDADRGGSATPEGESASDRFFSLSCPQGRGAGVARQVTGEQRAMPPEPSRVEAWTVPSFVVDGVASDYLANDAGLRLCSARLRAAIDASIGRRERAQWLPCQVTSADGPAMFFALHLESYPDILDREASIMVGEGFVVNAVVDVARAKGAHVVGFPGAASRLLVSEATVNRIRSAGCTGFELRRVPQSPT